MPIRKAAGAVIFHRWPGSKKVEYLLLKHSESYWNFAKGGIEKGEKEIEAARRETLEETGLYNIKIIPGFKIVEKYFYRAPKNYSQKEFAGKTVLKIVSFYLAQSKTKKVKISHEHLGFEWLNLKDALERIGKGKAHEQSRNILIRADNFINRRNIIKKPA